MPPSTRDSFPRYFSFSFLFSCTHLDFLFAFLVLLPLRELSAHPDLTRPLSPSQVLRLGPGGGILLVVFDVVMKMLEPYQ